MTGDGRAFAAGGDLAMLGGKAREAAADRGGETRAANRSFMEGFYRLYLAVRELSCPSVAAINGAAIGAGLCVALACDLRIAARGVVTGGAAFRLPRFGEREVVSLVARRAVAHRAVGVQDARLAPRPLDVLEGIDSGLGEKALRTGEVLRCR